MKYDVNGNLIGEDYYSFPDDGGSIYLSVDMMLPPDRGSFLDE